MKTTESIELTAKQDQLITELGCGLVGFDSAVNALYKLDQRCKDMSYKLAVTGLRQIDVARELVRRKTYSKLTSAKSAVSRHWPTAVRTQSNGRKRKPAWDIAGTVLDQLKTKHNGTYEDVIDALLARAGKKTFSKSRLAELKVSPDA